MKRYTKTRYFRREWKELPGGSQLFGGLKFTSFSLPSCTIYGYEDDSDYPEDHRLIDEQKERGLVFGWWFSVNCIDGEPGSQPLDAMTEISKEEFDSAQTRGWKP